MYYDNMSDKVFAEFMDRYIRSKDFINLKQNLLCKFGVSLI